ncbi:uncharacterized protein FIBRA_08248 [Fibroporia radiculosa]|uniref:Uncharacterized protein n=1 Tax=Fibroporia radiculosa TaxID=599839 RepID=J4GWG2_9APHY|nr:uncharacterized protein FIBRA_08248 [Fibroporia radiculosa]CCM06005.1 predicted protein [Fibroporia radiculosa]
MPALPTDTADVPQYVCYQNAEILKALAFFMGSNFLAHTASVPSSGELGRYTKRAAARKSLPYAAIISLFLPFGGLARAVLLVAQQLKWKSSELHAALAHGCIFIVARTEDWEPALNRTEIVYVKLPYNYEKLGHASKSTHSRLYAKFEIQGEKEDVSHWSIQQQDYLLHGEQRLPAGYTLAIPADKSITGRIIGTTISEPDKVKIHHPPNLLRVAAAIVQIVSAIVTIATSTTDQLTNWGYSSYMLSVIPYALMSAMNLACTGVVGDYSSGYVLRTHIMEEARRRPSALFDGTVGTLKDRSDLIGSRGASGYTAVKLCLKERTFDRSEQIAKVLVVETEYGVKEFLYNPGSTDCDVRFRISAISHDGPGNYGHSPKPQHKMDTLDSDVISESETLVNEDESPFSENPPYKDIFRHSAFKEVSWFEILYISISFIVALLIPYVLIYVFTNFDKGEKSTFAQRAWMMTWLAADQVSALGTLIAWLVWTKWAGVIPTFVHYCFISVLTIPAMGGFIVVGQMFLEDRGFGTCLNS